MKRLLLTIFALVAMAAGVQATDYGFNMLFVPITSDNYQSESAGKAWSYDPAANVLHLKDGYITPTIPGDVTILEIDGDVNPSLKIQVDGNCRFSGSFLIGILFTGNGNHIICGEGTLTMNSDKVNPTIIESRGSTSLTIKDVTINIQAWGDLAVGFSSVRFREVILDYCEINIKTPVYAWAAFGGNGVEPVLKNCYLSNGSFSDGDAVDATGSSHINEVYIKRAIFVYDVAVTVDEPVVGNVVSTNCTPNSDDYYVDDFFWVRFDGRSYDYMLEGSTFIKGEYYTAYVTLVPKEGERFADKNDMKVYVNGKEGEIFHWGAESMTLMYTFPPLIDIYDLWVGATQVTELNQEDVLGDGCASYDPSTKTLTLKGGTIQAMSGSISLGSGIYSEVDGLTIDVQGNTEVVGASTYYGIFLGGTTTITGNAKASVSGRDGLFSAKDTLTIGGNVELEVTGDRFGMYGAMDLRPVTYYSTLTIKDNAKVSAKGNTGVSLGRWKEIILADGFSVTAPEGASVGTHFVVDAGGSDGVIGGEWVVIERTTRIRGDANLDGVVDIADVVAVLNAMANDLDAPQFKVNDDNVVDIADVVAVLNIMAQQ